MQAAATPFRKSSVDLVSHRSAAKLDGPRAEPSDDAFARRLDDARSSSKRTDDNDAQKSADAAQESRGDPPTAQRTTSGERADAKRRVARAESRDDAAEESEPTAREAAAAKPKRSEASDASDADVASIEGEAAPVKPAEFAEPVEQTPADLSMMNVAVVTAPASEASGEAADPEGADEGVEAVPTLAAVGSVAIAAGEALDEAAGDEAAGTAEAAASDSTKPIVAMATLKDGKPAERAAPDPAANADAAATAAPAGVTPTADGRPAGEGGGDGADAETNDASTPSTAGTRPESAASTFDALLAKFTGDAAPAAKPAEPTPTMPAVSPERRFVEENVEKVVTTVRAQATAGGGEMRMRLDPPELGALDVAVKMLDGRMTASFTTSNDHATQLLSHSLSDLKQSLEASGINVDRIQVRQSSTAERDAQQQPGNDGQRRDGGAFDGSSQRGDQQRKEAVERMWRKLAYGSDELDFVA